ncbi:MAG TPA: FAD-dependent oxidoreductase [Pirellulales bacterium]|nr:FAD-dependent oxidoreductase [Pirellulales bacterium]
MSEIHLQVDVAVIGAGFGGSLTALLLQRLGRTVAVVERGSHPRFALGESATPLADLVLGDLARRFDLPRIAPLAEYGTWQQTYPQLVCGLKRGFSYFHHLPGEPWQPQEGHANELLIAASEGPADADTHWLRSQFDQFVVGEARAAGVSLLERAEIGELVGGPPWRLSGTFGGETFVIDASFIVDASGEGRVLAKKLNIADEPQRMQTCSRSIYGHFRDIHPWCEIMQEVGASLAHHPFPCDDAAVHQVFDGGWMWQLRFNNGVTSAGWLLDAERFSLQSSLPAAEEWKQWLARIPSIGSQFRDARLIDPPEGLRRTPRLQHRLVRSAGPGWAILPTTVYTLDALHSTGNAHTLAGIERLIDLIEEHWLRGDMTSQLAEYNRVLQAEITHIDTLVHGCYRAMGQFELFAPFTMFYFIAAHNCEARRREGRRKQAFLWAAEPGFCVALAEMHERLVQITRAGPASPADVRSFALDVARHLDPYNVAGLKFPIPG